MDKEMKKLKINQIIKNLNNLKIYKKNVLEKEEDLKKF